MGRILALLMAALVIQGCTVDKKDARQRQERPAKSYSNYKPNPQAKAFYGIDLEEIYQLQQNEQRPTELVQKIVRPLLGLLTTQKNLSNQKFVADSRARWALGLLNSTLIRISQQDSQLIEAELNQYANAVLYSCHTINLASCKNVDFFRQDSGTAQILTVLANREKNIQKYYDFLFIAYDLKNSIVAPILDRLSYARMTELLKEYLSVSKVNGLTVLKTTSMNSERKKRFEFIVHFFSLVIASSSAQLTADASMVELFDWMASGQLNETLGNELGSAINKLVSQHMTDKALWSRFVTTFDRFERSNENSYSRSLERVKKAQPRLLELLGVTPLNISEEIKSGSKKIAALFFIERLFDLQSTVKLSYLWQMADLSAKEGAELIKNYVQVTLIDQSLKTHQRLSAFYKDYLKDGRAKEELIQEAIRFADENLTSQWRDYVFRVQHTEDFFVEQIQRHYQNDLNAELTHDLNSVGNFLTNINSTILYMATYPSQIMLTYYAAKENLNIHVNTPYGAIDINRDVVLNDLMEAKIPPLFQFTSFKKGETDRNDTKIDSVQLFWSLYYTFALDVPNSYQVSQREFLETFFKSYMNVPDQKLKAMISRFERIYSANSNFNQLLGDCRQLQAGRPMAPKQMSLESLKTSTVLGRLDDPRLAREPLKSTLAYIHTPRDQLAESSDEAVELLRSDIDPILLRLDFLRSAMRLSPRHDNAAIQMAAEMIDSSKKEKTRLLGYVDRTVNDLPACITQFDGLERQRQKELHAMEIQYLSLINQALNALAGGLDTAVTRLKSSNNPFFADINDQLPALRSINELFARKSGMTNILGSITGYTDDFYQKGGIQLTPSGQPYFNNRKIDLYIRMASFMSSGFLTQKMSNAGDNFFFTFPQSLRQIVHTDSSYIEAHFLYATSQEIFIRRAMEDFGQFLPWLRETPAATNIYRAILRQKVAKIKYDSLLESPDSISADISNLLDYNLGVLESTRLKEEDSSVLNMFPGRSFYNLSSATSTNQDGPQLLFLTSNGQDNIIGLTDEIFTFVTSIRLGYAPKFRDLRPAAENTWTGDLSKAQTPQTGFDQQVKEGDLITRTDIYASSKSFYLSLRDRDKLLHFTLPAEIDQQIEHFHRRIIDNDATFADLFTQTLSSWSQSHPLPQVRFSLRRPLASMEYLSTSLFRNYQMQMAQFHRDTTGVFQKPSSQPH